MKKYIVTALALLCLLCFSSCSPYPNGDEENVSADGVSGGTEASTAAENGGAEHVGGGGVHTDVGNGEYGVGFDF